MTLAMNTIECQLDELKGQYKFAQNIIRELLDHSHELEQRVERQDRLIHALRETITATEQKLTAAECKACRCDEECC